MTYKDAVALGIANLASNPKTIFIGYNLKYGSKSYGAFNNIDEKQIIEMPLSEALMTGMSIGMSLCGYLPVLCYERHDFILLGLDQIINHLNLIAKLSHNEYRPRVVIRAIVGGTKPFHPGLQHIKDFTSIISMHTNLAVFEAKCVGEITDAYRYAIIGKKSVFISEYRDSYTNTDNSVL